MTLKVGDRVIDSKGAKGTVCACPESSKDWGSNPGKTWAVWDAQKEFGPLWCSTSTCHLFAPAAPVTPKLTYEVQNKTGLGTAVIECRVVEKIERTELAMFNRYGDAEAFAQMKRETQE